MREESAFLDEVLDAIEGIAEVDPALSGRLDRAELQEVMRGVMLSSEWMERGELFALEEHLQALGASKATVIRAVRAVEEIGARHGRRLVRSGQSEPSAPAARAVPAPKSGLFGPPPSDPGEEPGPNPLNEALDVLFARHEGLRAVCDVEETRSVLALAERNAPLPRREAKAEDAEAGEGSTSPLWLWAAAGAAVLVVLLGVLGRIACDAKPPPRPKVATPEMQAEVRARLALGAAEAFLAEGRLDEAFAALREAEAALPDDPARLKLLATVELRRGRGEEACRAMRRYVAVQGTKEPTRSRLIATACDP